MKRTIFVSFMLVSALNALSMQEAVDTTLKNSIDLKKISMGIDMAKHDIKEKKSSNYGKIDLSASAIHYNMPRTLTPLTPALMQSGAVIPSTQDMLSAGVSYDVNLFNGYADVTSIEIASIQKEITKSLHLLTKEQLIYNVKSIYINILSLKSQAKAQQEYIDALQKLHQSVQLKVKLGSAAKIDALKSMADLTRAKTALSNIQTNIKILKETLASMMLKDEIGDLKDIGDIDVDTKILQKIQTYKDDILKTSKLKMAQLDTQKKKQLQRKSDAMYYPKVNFNAYYGQNGGVNDDTNPRSGKFDHEDIWQVGFILKWNIFDFGKKNSMVQKSKIAYLQSKLEESKVKRELQKNLVEALSKIEQSVQNYTNAKTELELMQETQKIEQLRYDNGASDINDLLYTKARYQMAKSSYVASKYNYKNSVYYLEYILEKGEEK